jgi:DNA-binding transcriptional LysR family regulator
MSLPSLKLLRSFALLGETLSVKRAAERLHVSPTALSHQLRELEAALDCKLFERLPRGLALTDEGQQFWAEIAPAIKQITQATLARLAARPLRISAFPYLAQILVLPALAELQALAGGRALGLETRRDTLALSTHGIDLGLRFAPEASNWGDLHARRLCTCTGVPVIGGSAPALAWPPAPELQAIRLSKDTQSWSAWAEVHGWQPKGEGLVLDSYAAVLSAAEQGLGVAMGFVPLCVQALENKQLRPAWPGKQVGNGALWAVWPAQLDGPELLRVVDCLAQKLQSLEQRSAEFFSAQDG